MKKVSRRFLEGRTADFYLLRSRMERGSKVGYFLGGDCIIFAATSAPDYFVGGFRI